MIKMTQPFALVFDLETTGLPKGVSIYELANYDSCRIVQICWTIVDLTEFTIVEDVKSYFIKPESFTISDDMFCVKYGMNHSYLTDRGVPLQTVIRELRQDILKWQPSFLMGHNVEFDVLGLMSEVYRLYKEVNRPYELFRNKDGSYPRLFCTYQLCSLLRENEISPYIHMKTLKLGYLYKVLCKKDLENAHTADADVLACIEIGRNLSEYVGDIICKLDKNYDKGLLFATQNKREWLQKLTLSNNYGNQELK